MTDSLARAVFAVGFEAVGFDDMIVDLEAAGSAVKDKRQIDQMRKFSTIT